MLLRAMPGPPDNTGGVGFVQHGKQVIFFCKLHQTWQVDNITVHAENRIADNQTMAAHLCSLNFLLQIRHIIMMINNSPRRALPTAINNTGMVQFITENHIISR